MDNKQCLYYAEIAKAEAGTCPQCGQESRPPFPQQAASHSGTGVASFVLGIVVSLAAFALVSFGIASVYIKGASAATLATGAGIGLFAAWALSVAGLSLGMAGVWWGGAKKVFAVLGIILNGLYFLGGLYFAAMGFLFLVFALS